MEKVFEVRYEGDYKTQEGYARRVYCDTFEQAMKRYTGACERAATGKIQANHIQIRRVCDQRICADCRIWETPITAEAYLDEISHEVGRSEKVPQIKARLAAMKAEIEQLEKVI